MIYEASELIFIEHIMSRFEVYEINNAENVVDIIPKIADSLLSWKYKEFKKQTFDNVQGRTVLLTFLFMSNQRKINLLTYMFQLVHSLHTLADILNIFSAVNTKLMTYSKVSEDSNSLYDQFVHDDDRMLDQDALEESLVDTKGWFTSLDDVEQLNIITSLLRLSGGNVIKKMYMRLIKMFNKRNAEGKEEFKEYKSCSSMLFVDKVNQIQVSDIQPSCVNQDVEDDYDPNHPTTLKVVELRKQWQANMAKLRKEIDIEIQLLNDPNAKQNKMEDRPRGGSAKKKKDDSVSKKSAVKSLGDPDCDWVQFLPLWNVKKIFSYLDDATLQKLKNVNIYWSTISKEVLEEKKTRQYLNSIIKKSEESLRTSLGISQTMMEVKKTKNCLITEPSGYWKKMEKQRRTATAIRRQSEVSKNLQNVSAVVECLKEFYTKDIPFLDELRTFPTNMGVRSEYVSEDSSSESFSGVVNLDDDVSNKFFQPQNNEVSSKSSTMSLVPSIVATTESMQTW